MRAAYLFVWYLGLQLAVLFLCFVFTEHEHVNVWYSNLTKPGFMPPRGAFAPVWGFLYFCIGLAGWLIAVQERSEHRSRALHLWYLQTIFNFLWIYSFFYLHTIGWSLIDIILLDCIVLSLLFYSRRASFLAFILLIPYFGWIAFATILNIAVYISN